MSTNLALDDRLIEEARAVGGHKTKRDAVNAALAEYVQRRKQMRITGLFGKIDYDPAYDYKAERQQTRMMVVVDTSIWSLALRRVSGALSTQQQKQVHALRELLSEGRVQLLGAVRQELLSGIRHKEQFVRLRDYLRFFPDLVLGSEDYETAAAMSNTCRILGVAGSPTDLLICSAASRRGSAIFTSDRDFETYAKHLSVKLYS